MCGKDSFNEVLKSEWVRFNHYGVLSTNARALTVKSVGSLLA